MAHNEDYIEYLMSTASIVNFYEIFHFAMKYDNEDFKYNVKEFFFTNFDKLSKDSNFSHNFQSFFSKNSSFFINLLDFFHKKKNKLIICKILNFLLVKIYVIFSRFFFGLTLMQYVQKLQSFNSSDNRQVISFRQLGMGDTG